MMRREQLYCSRGTASRVLTCRAERVYEPIMRAVWVCQWPRRRVLRLVSRSQTCTSTTSGSSTAHSTISLLGHLDDDAAGALVGLVEAREVELVQNDRGPQRLRVGVLRRPAAKHKTPASCQGDPHKTCAHVMHARYLRRSGALRLPSSSQLGQRCWVTPAFAEWLQAIMQARLFAGTGPPSTSLWLMILWLVLRPELTSKTDLELSPRTMTAAA